MIRSVLVLVLSLFVADSLVAQPRTVVCESRNGSYKRCDVGDVSRAWIEERLSDSECVANRTWGFDRRGIWVNGGCRAEFAYQLSGGNIYDDGDDYRGGSSTVIRCESKGGRRTYCDADTRRGVYLDRQLSILDCEEGVSWGYDRRGIWVDAGCRADFRIGSRRPGGSNDGGWGGGSGGGGSRDSIVCESLDGRRKTCRVDTRGGVSIMRQISKTQCVLDQNWGWDRNSIWVTDGCRAEFRLGDRGGDADKREMITCESRDGRRSQCDAMGPVRRARLYRQKSDTECIAGENWGWTRRGVWVDDGCRGIFEVTRE